MAYFNIILRPDQQFSDICREFAQKHFAAEADGYCLSDQVHGHITLTQFQAATAEDAARAADFLKPEDVAYKPYFESMLFPFGQGRHQGKIWAWLNVQKDGELLKFQARAFEALREAGLEPKTAMGAGYVPHVTLARLSDKAQITFGPVPEEMRGLNAYAWRLTVGYSDVNGQYLGDL